MVCSQVRGRIGGFVWFGHEVGSSGRGRGGVFMKVSNEKMSLSIFFYCNCCIKRKICLRKFIYEVNPFDEIETDGKAYFTVYL
jgi:hypothetical protein